MILKLNYEILEITDKNQEKYLEQIVNLEQKVVDKMEKQGKTGQLFTTGKEGILEYIKSNSDTVMCAIDNENDQVKAATYITQGQDFFTYNDITKYFKFGSEYQEHVKKSLGVNYELRMLNTYKSKLKAYKYAESKILKEHPEFNSISEFMSSELNSSNGFDEKSVLREKMNSYMYEYIKEIGMEKDYEQFYWITSKDIFNVLNKQNSNRSPKKPEISEYDEFIENEKLIIYSKNMKNAKQYFNANPNNSIEIDTYITDPNSRSLGLARILVYEGIKKHIISNFENPKNNEIYLCSTLHKDNLSSKYVSEFFGLKDYLFVKRRQNRERQVHICKIERENYKNYLENMQDKLIVFYGYNPTNKQLADQRVLQILEEQLEYERTEYHRLNKIRNNKKDFKGNLTDIQTKLDKMGALRRRIAEIKARENNGDER